MHAAFAKEWEALLDVEFNKLLDHSRIHKYLQLFAAMCSRFSRHLCDFGV